MNCVVTGKETNNKWRGYVICKEVVELAKQMEGENGFLGCTLRERIIILQQQWKKRAKEEADKIGDLSVPSGPIAITMAKVRELMRSFV